METIRGIVLRTVKYGDDRLILDLFTESRGRMSFITKKAGNRRVPLSKAFWQPLSMVEFQAEVRLVVSLPRPRDVRFYYNYVHLPFSPVKSAIALFLAEFLSAALKEEKQHTSLYKYIEHSLQWFDEARFPMAIANFHLVFLMHLTRFLGIFPNLEEPARFFNLLSGTFQPLLPSHAYYIKDVEAQSLPRLFRMNYATAHLFKFSAVQRRRIIEVLNTYYRLHLPDFPELKSVEVLHEVFS
ncbi:MAG: DNA repair protein RecO [Bacteroidaceae bacterium]|nr:DNA repair protein RecO [Bacteroidaceae bacterium]